MTDAQVELIAEQRIATARDRAPDEAGLALQPAHDETPADAPPGRQTAPQASSTPTTTIAEAMMRRVAERFSVLGQVVRLRLIEQLATGSATPQELAEALGLTQQNVSKHLQILDRNGLVNRRPEGANAIYTLKDESTLRVLDEVTQSVTQDLRELASLATVTSHDARSKPV